MTYINGYKKEFVEQYHKGYTAGFAMGRKEAMDGISGSELSGPSISGAPPTSGGEGPSGTLLLEHTGGAKIKEKMMLNPYDSDSDEDNFLKQDEFLYLLRHGGINKRSITDIKNIILACP
jgi:hypothetical protein